MKSQDQRFVDYFESKFKQQGTDLESLLDTLKLQITLVESAERTPSGKRNRAARHIDEAKALLRRISEALGRTQEVTC